MSYKNPFKYLGSLNPRDDKPIIVERPELLEKTIFGIRAGNYFAIYGSRKSGKTTFINQLDHELSDYMFTVKLYFQNTVNTLEKFHTWFFDEIKRNHEIKTENQNIKTNVDFENALIELTRNIDKPLVLFFDDFEKCPILKDILILFRLIIEARNNYSELKKIIIVMAGGGNLISHSIHANSPFNIADTIELRDFTYKETEKLIDDNFTPNNREFDSEVIDELYGHTSGHPKLTQHLLNLLFGKLSQQISIRQFRDCLKQLDENSNHSISSLEKTISQDENLGELLRELINGEKIKIYPYREYINKGAGVIKDVDGYCQFRNPIFENFAKKFLGY